MNLKKILKTIKYYERELSVFFGVLILLLAGLFVVNYIRNLRNNTNIQNSNSNQNIQTHTVTKGETLWSISQKYYQKGSDWKKIAEANKIDNPVKLEVGQELTIPEVETEKEPTTSTTPSTTSLPTPQITKEAASTTSGITGETYIVVKGDNLWKIAVRAYNDGYKWVEIAKANSLKNPNLIHSGNSFIIPR